ncbi:zinc finger BED domain-containing protein 4-like [Musca autumnalis]|uniref:zinc finger BED domain-containing protein 4-like n=1 Tax=Musca autumnalis TaxID=221902 RepID=UPI003CEF079B
METSVVWTHFKRGTVDTAVCNICSKTISCKGKSTSGLIRHLKGIHSTIINNKENSESPPKKTRVIQSTLDKYTSKKDSLCVVVGKLAAVDGMSIRTITRSSFIRESMSIQGFHLPKTERDIQQLIILHFTEVKSCMKIDIESMLNKRQRFSLVMDEWTSIKHRKYLNICLLGDEKTFFNLGMIYIPGKSGANEIRDLLDYRLQEYGISLENQIVATITDGPNVMKKIVNNSPANGIFCLSHAIHLAVTDVFYKKPTAEHPDSDSSVSDGDDFDFENNDIDGVGETLSIDITYKTILNQTRKIIKLFRRSPAKNNILQKYVVEDHNKEIALELDIVTRWNSIVPMLTKFLLLKKSIKKALIDLNKAELWIESNINVLQTLVDVLEPIKIAVEALCRPNINLISANAILNVLCKQISTIKNPLAQTMFDNLKQRIEERRDKRLYTLMQYLKDPNLFNSTDPNCLFARSTKTQTIMYAEDLFARLFGDTNASDNNIIVEEEQTSDILFQEIINKAIDQANLTTKPISKMSLKQEFKYLEGSGKVTDNLQCLFDALLTIRPSSVESERIFSLAGIFVNKIRNRLSDETINALSVLKTYFSSKQEKHI